jgi:hypothetical protein
MSAGEPGGEVVLRSEELYAGKLLTLRRDEVRLENGR